MSNVTHIYKNVHVQPSPWTSKGFVFGITLFAIGIVGGVVAPMWSLLTS
jgi:Mn2+/Fe2+ NRAMP family transporter